MNSLRLLCSARLLNSFQQRLCSQSTLPLKFTADPLKTPVKVPDNTNEVLAKLMDQNEGFDAPISDGINPFIKAEEKCVLCKHSKSFA